MINTSHTCRRLQQRRRSSRPGAVMKAIFSLFAILAFAVFTTATSASADSGDPPQPLRLKVVTFDGKKKLKVSKKLRVVTSCSKDCNAKIEVKLFTPVTTYRFNAETGIPATGTWTVGLRLTKFARKYIRKNINRSRMVVTYQATDLETGLKPTLVKTFRFRK